MKKRILAQWMMTFLLAAAARPAAAQEEAPPPETPAAPESLAEQAALPVPEAPAAEPAATAAVELVELVTERETPGVESTKGELITITLDNVPVQDAIRMFTRISGANIVSGKDIKGNVTVSLKDVEWEPALRIILDSVNLALVEKSPGIYTVLSKADLALEPLTIETYTLRYQTISNILPIVQKMLIASNASAAGASGVNTLVVRETADQLGKIREVIGKIDKPRPQVFIEAKFIELNDQAIKDLGINWQALQGYTIGAGGMTWTLNDSRTRTKDTFTGYAETERRAQSDLMGQLYDQYGVSSPAGTEIGSGEAGFVSVPEGLDKKDDSLGLAGRGTIDAISRARTYDQSTVDQYNRTLTDVRAAVLSASDFSLVLSALKQNSGVSIISNPKIVVASGETASILVGSKRPNVSAVPLRSDSEGIVQFLYRLDGYLPVGVLVDVTPIVNTESNITVRIIPELSRAPRSEDEVIPQTGQRFPVMTISRVDTEFNVENNRTVAIGGLSLTDDEEKIIKVPVLGDLPLIGKYLFTHTKTQKVQNEIVIFVTVALANPGTIYERSGIPSESQLIHRHLTAREAQQVETGNGTQKANGKKK
ncbi:MAG: hypothetical protein KA248_03045 [Kiritimatiellae bacterium]|nr:hypothetical protein [Kiritimatiellia bacterium]